MKKQILTLLLVLGALAANAQTTVFNIRLGAGLMNADAEGESFHPEIGENITIPTFAPAIMFQACIDIDKQHKWIFAPTLDASMNVAGPGSMFLNIAAPMMVGYNVNLGHGKNFVPKFGIAAGYSIVIEDNSSYSYASGYSGIGKDINGTFIAGPSFDLTYEFGKFLIGISGYYSFASSDMQLAKQGYLNKVTGEIHQGYMYGSDYELQTRTTTAKFNPYSLKMTFGYKF